MAWLGLPDPAELNESGHVDDHNMVVNAIKELQSYLDALTVAAGVTSVNGRSGVVTLNSSDKTTLGLGNVDNTSDATKLASQDVLDKLAGKALSIHGHTWSDITGTPTSGLNGIGQAPVFTLNPISNGQGTLRWYNDTGRTLTMRAVRATLSTVSTGGNPVAVNVSINGSALAFSNPNTPSIAVGSLTAVSTTFQNAAVTNGQYITVNVDSSGTHVSTDDLMVTITFEP